MYWPLLVKASILPPLDVQVNLDNVYKRGGRYSVVGIATCYALEGLGIEFGGGGEGDFRCSSGLSPMPKQPPGYRVFPGGKATGVWC